MGVFDLLYYWDETSMSILRSRVHHFFIYYEELPSYDYRTSKKFIQSWKDLAEMFVSRILNSQITQKSSTCLIRFMQKQE